MPGPDSLSYRLLGILQELAPDGPAQEVCAEMYRALEADLPAVSSGHLEAMLQLQLAQALVDGLRSGNWPWDGWTQGAEL